MSRCMTTNMTAKTAITITGAVQSYKDNRHHYWPHHDPPAAHHDHDLCHNHDYHVHHVQPTVYYDHGHDCHHDHVISFVFLRFLF